MMVFVKMCREAVELQELWKPKSGDLYHYHGVINPLRPLMVKTDVHGGVMDWDRGEFFKNCFWLPRQEDLQELFRHKNGNPDEYWILKSFLVWFSHLTGYPTACPDREVSITQLWLQYVMETVYQKRWNGESWEEIVNDEK